jgi:hypothetical protein
MVMVSLTKIRTMNVNARRAAALVLCPITTTKIIKTSRDPLARTLIDARVGRALCYRLGKKEEKGSWPEERLSGENVLVDGSGRAPT